MAKFLVFAQIFVSQLYASTDEPEGAVNVCFWRRPPPIDATFYPKGKDGVIADETKISLRIHDGREDGVVGSLVTGGVIECD